MLCDGHCTGAGGAFGNKHRPAATSRPPPRMHAPCGRPRGVHGPAPTRAPSRPRRVQAASTGTWRKKRSQHSSRVGPESSIPNVYWQALPLEHLRRMPSFTALPPPELLQLAGAPTYSYVRQDSELWSALHRGRLTTSRLKDALGLREPSAARIVGGPQYPEAGVMKAYHHLLQPPWEPPPHAARQQQQRQQQGQEQAPGAQQEQHHQQQQPGAGGLAEALAHNEAARCAFNELLRAEAGAAGPAGGDGVGLSGFGDQAAMRDLCELLALSGANAAGSASLRLTWGSVQEAAALVTLAGLLPGSQLQEVGLVMLEQPGWWGADAATLPQLGASPDALVTHQVPVLACELQDARARLHDACAASSGAAPGREQAAHAALALLRASLERHTSAQVQGALQACAGGAGSLQLPPHASGPVSVAGAGSAQPRPSALHCIALHCSNSRASLEWLTDQLLQRPSPGMSQPIFGQGASAVAAGAACAAGAGIAGLASGSGSSAGGGVDGSVAAVLPVREAVEVKSHCPFLFKETRKARNRGVNVRYVMSDRGPVAAPWALWVPQLQAHMAASSAFSALLLSRSATRGVRLFRMHRDDDYIRQMLGLLAELQQDYVRVQRPPGSDPWVGRPGQAAFLEATLALARSCTVVAETQRTPALTGADGRAFW